MSTVGQGQDERAESGGGRVLAMTLLILALAAQLLFALIGLLGLALGGTSGAEFALFLGVAIVVLLGLLSLLVSIVRRRWRPRAAWLALAAPLADVAVLAILSTGGLAGSCSDQELQTIGDVPPFPGSALEWDYDGSTGSCAATLEVAATAEEVLEHYERALEATGWSVTIEDVPTRSAGPEAVVVKDLSARRRNESFTIALESYSGTTSAAIRIDSDAFGER